MIFSHEKISMISVISSLSLKLYINSLVYHRNIFGSSLKVFGNLRKSSDIFGNSRKFSENVRECSYGLRNNFGKSSEIFRKSSKTPSSVCLYNKKNITRQLKEMNFMFSWQEQYFTCLLRSLVRYCSCHSNIKFISSRHRVISSTYIAVMIFLEHFYHMPKVVIFFPGNLQLLYLRNLHRFSENVRKRLSGLQTTFRESLEIFGNLQKYSEIFGKQSRKSSLVCSFSIWICLTRTGNYQINKFDWLKWILTAVQIFPFRPASRPVMF